MADAVLGYLLAAASLLFFTTAILTTKVASTRISLGLGFLIATFVNVVFAGLALGVQLSSSAAGVSWNGQALMLFALAGAFSTYLGRWFFYESVVRFGPARASIFQISSPLFTALIAWLLLGERLSGLAILGVCMTISGLILVNSKPGSFRRSVPGTLPVPEIAAARVSVEVTLAEQFLRSALLLGLGSSLAYAVGNVLRGAAVRSWNEPILGALAGALFGLCLQLVFSADKAGLAGRLRTASRSGCWLYGLIGVCTISGQICTIGAMRYIPLSIATLVTLCTPILVFPFSHMLFKNQEGITARTLVGGVLTLLGIAMVVLR